MHVHLSQAEVGAWPAGGVGGGALAEARGPTACLPPVGGEGDPTLSWLPWKPWRAAGQ